MFNYLKKLALFVPALLLFCPLISHAQQVSVSSQTGLRSALENNIRNIVISTSFAFTADLSASAYLDKITNISFSDHVEIDGGNSWKGFEFVNSTVTIAYDYGNTYEDTGTGIFFRPTFMNFTSTSSGAVISANGSYLAIENLYLKSNFAVSGGAVFVSSSRFISNNVWFDYNEAADKGGALFLENSVNSRITGGTFWSNTALEGGAAYFLSVSSLSIEDVDAWLNKADNGGGFYINNSQNIMISSGSFLSLEFIGNTAYQNGGALYISDSVNVEFSGLGFIYNLAHQDGGAAFMDNSEVSFFSVGFTSNSALSGSGGAIYSLDSSLIVSGGEELGSFTGNIAAASGGALYMEGGNAVVANVNFSQNEANAGGGAYIAMSPVASFTNVSFSGNLAQNGGAIFVDKSNVAINNGKFSDNTAASNGGAIYVLGDSSNTAVLTINALQSAVEFISNTAAGAGNDIYLDNYSQLILNAQNHDILINGGIAALSISTITKTGSGNLYLNGNSVIAGDFNVSKGGLVLKDSASLSMAGLTVLEGAAFSTGKNSTVNASGTLEINPGGLLNVTGASSFYADTLNMCGDLKIGVDLKNGTSGKIGAGTLKLSSATSMLTGFDGNLWKGSGTFVIAEASSIAGSFKYSSGRIYL